MLGLRSDLLMGFASENKLTSTNDDADLPWKDVWTFESSLGIRRRLDYIMVSDTFHIIRAGASNQLDLGSDHRAVGAC
ncbi:hypothetical protein, partial [Mycobacterium sp.]|uniref:hypothetical protein n=1 Tax=Mycobacterium sp. TaxID=1785 RepID=UPI0025F673E0